MLEDETIHEVLANGGAIAIGDIAAVEVLVPNTRGQQVVYDIRIDGIVAGVQLDASPVKACHMGKPLAANGMHVAVALVPSDRFNPALQLFALEEIADEHAETALRERIGKAVAQT